MTNIDNALIIGAIIRRSSHSQFAVISWSIAALTISRTVCILAAHNLFMLPGLRLVSGIILLLIAIRMANSRESRQNTSLLYQIFMVLVTDLTISFDSILTTAIVSHNPFYVSLGVFLSLCFVFLIIPILTSIFAHSFWVQLFTAAIIAQLAVHEMVSDHLLETWTIPVQKLITSVDQWVVMAVGTVVFAFFFDVVNSIRQKISN